MTPLQALHILALLLWDLYYMFYGLFMTALLILLAFFFISINFITPWDKLIWDEKPYGVVGIATFDTIVLGMFLVNYYIVFPALVDSIEDPWAIVWRVLHGSAPRPRRQRMGRAQAMQQLRMGLGTVVEVQLGAEAFANLEEEVNLGARW
ncbi:hypothetical protein BDV95DRAFT_591525 [Massariosphaeria phaeospora]|uniref:Uncharacterized protein n=1 Tax=Massariosphaeria phaeospora TaxID=100035 RepID=A0A7C8IE44_9PLEO|nr:hypothetical protein BDV95DRAFT_591525 [Massariosphaeria phaeospora]